MIPTKDGKARVFVYPFEETYGTEGCKRIIESFKELNVSTKGVGFGGGASGLMPELNLAVVTFSSLVAAGFLGALGVDVYKLLKKGIIKIINIKPKRNSPSLPPNYSGALYTHLIWWLRFDDKRVLAELNLSKAKQVEAALLSLPKCIDELVEVNDGEALRICWDGKKWQKC